MAISQPSPTGYFLSGGYDFTRLAFSNKATAAASKIKDSPSTPSCITLSLFSHLSDFKAGQLFFPWFQFAPRQAGSNPDRSLCDASTHDSVTLKADHSLSSPVLGVLWNPSSLFANLAIDERFSTPDNQSPKKVLKINFFSFTLKLQ